MSGETPVVREALAVYEPEAPETESVPPGYKQTEVGVIPEDWEIVPLSELLDFRNGVNADKSAYGQGTPFINVLEVITQTHIRSSDIPGLVTLPSSLLDSYAVHRGDVLFNRTSETQEEVGLASVYLGDETVVFGGFVIRGRSRGTAVDESYSGYAFRSPTIRSQIISKGQGAVRSNIGQQELSKVVAVLPPLPEQRAIAAALSDVDDLISALDKLIAKKRVVKTAAMQRLLTGKQRLQGFSGEWEVRRFGDVFSFLSTANNPRSDLSEHGDIGYVHYGDLHATDSSFLDCSRAKIPHISRDKVKDISLLEEGDLVMVDASEDYEGVGKSVEVRNLNGRELVAGLHTLLLRGNKKTLADGFKGYLQYIPAVRSTLVKLATGISVYGISKNNVKSVDVSLPGLEEQTAIAAVLSDMDAEIEALEARREKTRRVKQGMMQELLTGRTRLV
jgi:type I restriction enzyme S subunit